MKGVTPFSATVSTAPNTLNTVDTAARCPDAQLLSPTRRRASAPGHHQEHARDEHVARVPEKSNQRSAAGVLGITSDVSAVHATPAGVPRRRPAEAAGRAGWWPAGAPGGGASGGAAGGGASGGGASGGVRRTSGRGGYRNARAAGRCRVGVGGATMRRARGRPADASPAVAAVAAAASQRSRTAAARWRFRRGRGPRRRRRSRAR